MRRVRHRWLRMRLAWARAVTRLPRAPRRAVRNVLIFWLAIITAAGFAVGAWKVWNEPEAVPASTWQRWYDTVDAARERLKIVDELIAEEGQLADVALKMALPVVTWQGERDDGASWQSLVRRAVRFLTGIDIADPVALLAVELPGFATYVEVAASSTLPASARTMTVSGGRFESEPLSGTPPPQQASEPLPAQQHIPPGSAAASLPDITRAPSPSPTPSGATAEREPTVETSPGLPGPTTPPVPELPQTMEIPTPELPETPSPASPTDRLRTVAWGDQCLVLIYHTHTSEMYRTDTFAPASPEQYHRFNTTDTGIVHVGREMAERLEELGIPACHLTTVHDWPSHPRAYIEARASVEQFLASHPHVEIVLDVHRDAPAGLVTTLEGQRAAQIALVLGTNAGMHPNWPANAAFGRAMAELFEARYPGLFRRIIERPDARLNQDLHPRAVLVEIGSYDTHLDEAIVSAQIVAEVVADMLYTMRFGHSAWDGL